MTWTPYVPRHLADAPIDSGASKEVDLNLTAYRDVWAGNPDTDKYWSK